MGVAPTATKLSVRGGCVMGVAPLWRMPSNMFDKAEDHIACALEVPPHDTPRA